jgi:hypothetical protein
METPTVRPSICLTVSNITVSDKTSLDFSGYSVGFLYKKISCQSDLRKNELSDPHTLLNSIKEILPSFPYFLNDFD